MKDELRERLARLDPMPPGVPTEGVTTPSSQELMEEIISTQVREKTLEPAHSRRWMSVAAAMALVVGVAAAFALGSDRGGQAMVLGASDPGITGICLQFSVEQLAMAEVAFEGTAVSVDGTSVELEVDRWFKGGEAGKVLLEAPTGLELLIDGIAFEVGASYLISASNGAVDYCGYSGGANDQLRSAFQAAFGG